MIYLKLKSYGITFTKSDTGTFPLFSRQLSASFWDSSGNWRQTHSTNDSKSFAKSSWYQSNSFGRINLSFFETPTDACRYCLFATSNSLLICDAVYTLTCFFKNSKSCLSNLELYWGQYKSVGKMGGERKAGEGREVAIFPSKSFYCRGISFSHFLSLQFPSLCFAFLSIWYPNEESVILPYPFHSFPSNYIIVQKQGFQSKETDIFHVVKVLRNRVFDHFKQNLICSPNIWRYDKHIILITTSLCPLPQ